MFSPLILASLWVVAAAIVACLPVRRQWRPGLCLVAVAPVLLFWLAVVHGPWMAAIGVAAFGSIFRRPLKGLYRRVRVPEPVG